MCINIIRSPSPHMSMQNWPLPVTLFLTIKKKRGGEKKEKKTIRKKNIKLESVAETRL